MRRRLVAPRERGNFPTKPLQGASDEEVLVMKPFVRGAISTPRFSPRFLTLLVGLVVAAPALAQASSPWENAANVLQQAFTTTIARGLSLVAIVVSGLTFAFGEGGSKRVIAGVLFGVGMAIAAVNFLGWLFP
jgi:type IV secretion system protein TrbC